MNNIIFFCTFLANWNTTCVCRAYVFSYIYIYIYRPICVTSQTKFNTNNTCIKHLKKSSLPIKNNFFQSTQKELKTMAHWSAENATKAYLSTMKMVSILQYILVTIFSTLTTKNSLFCD